MPAALSEDSAPSASLDHLTRGAAYSRLASVPWPQQLASDRAKTEGPPSSNHQAPETATEMGVASYPALLVLPGDDAAPVVYDGELKPAAVESFLGKFAAAEEAPAAQGEAKADADSSLAVEVPELARSPTISARSPALSGCRAPVPRRRPPQPPRLAPPYLLPPVAGAPARWPRFRGPEPPPRALAVVVAAAAISAAAVVVPRATLAGARRVHGAGDGGQRGRGGDGLQGRVAARL